MPEARHDKIEKEQSLKSRYYQTLRVASIHLLTILSCCQHVAELTIKFEPRGNPEVEEQDAG